MAVNAASRFTSASLPPYVVLFLWPFLLLWPAFFNPNAVLMQPKAQYSDLLISHWPNTEFLRRSLFEFHQFPFWTPAILGGAPFAADPLAGVWYLPNWLAVILPLPLAFNLLFALHLAWAGWGLYRWARADGFGIWPSLVGGLIFSAMPKLIAHIAAGHLSLVLAVCWLPWLLAQVESLIQQSNSSPIQHKGTETQSFQSAVIDHLSFVICYWSLAFRHSAWVALIWAATFLADVRWGVYAGLIMVAWWLIRSTEQGLIKTRKLYLQMFGGVLIFLLLTAVLWLPLWQFVQYSARAGLTLNEAAFGSLAFKDLVGFVLPNFGGAAENLTYFGLIGSALAILGAVKGRDRIGILAMVGLGLVSVWWALGPQAGLFTAGAWLPGLALIRVPARALFVVGLAVSWLAVRGLAVLEEGYRLAGRRWNMVTVGLLGALWILTIGVGFVAIKGLPIFLMTSLAVTGVLVGWRLRVAPQLTLGWVVLELFVFGASLIEPRSVPISPVAEWLSQQPGLWRVYSPAYSLPQLAAAQQQLEQVDGVNPLQLASLVEYMVVATGVKRSGYSVTVPSFEGDSATANASAQPDAKLLGALNVRYVVSEFDLQVAGLVLETRLGTTRIYRNEFDLGRVSGGELREWTPNRIVVSAAGPGRVTLAEVWYPGWEASSDGILVPVARDNIFRSVTVAADSPEIVFEYKPYIFYLGLTLSVFGFLIVFYSLVSAKGLGDN